MAMSILGITYFSSVDCTHRTPCSVLEIPLKIYFTFSKRLPITQFESKHTRDCVRIPHTKDPIPTYNVQNFKPNYSIKNKIIYSNYNFKDIYKIIRFKNIY